MTTITNGSGIWPAGYRVLVRPDEIERQTRGGIVIAETTREEHGQAQTTGTLVAIGPTAWQESGGRWANEGDKVLFAKYGGLLIDGQDGYPYRLLNDEQITAIASPEFSTSAVSRLEKRRAL